MKRRAAILISGRGSNMAALIDAAKAADFPAEIVAVTSNRADAPGLEKAAASGIKTKVIESRSFGKDRAGFEAVLQRALDEEKVELICLGGFMRLFTAGFVQRWYGKMLNIHPSLLPSFPGLDPHGQALKAGVKLSGATVHFVIPETDAGPIVIADMNGDGLRDLIAVNNRASRIEIHYQKKDAKPDDEVRAPTRVNEFPEHWRFRREFVSVTHQIDAIVPGIFTAD